MSIERDDIYYSDIYCTKVQADLRRHHCQKFCIDCK